VGSEAFTEHAPFASPLTTKGDVYVYDTADQRLPVGSDGQMLTADSTQTPGLKWADAIGWAVKTGDQSFTNNTLANVTNLSFSAAASTSYFIEIYYLLTSDNTNADYKFGFTGPASAAFLWSQENGDNGSTNSAWTPQNTGGTPNAFLTLADTYSVGAFNGSHGLKLTGVFRNSTNAGTFQCQAAQNTTQAGTSTKVLKDSVLRYRKLN
jgi:hypothetical protein